MTYQAIARHLGLTHQAIWLAERRAIRKLWRKSDKLKARYVEVHAPLIRLDPPAHAPVCGRD
jgi:hypothetical protein